MITSVLLFMSDSPSPYGARDALGGQTGKKTGLEALRGHRTIRKRPSDPGGIPLDSTTGSPEPGVVAEGQAQRGRWEKG